MAEIWQHIEIIEESAHRFSVKLTKPVMSAKKRRQLVAAACIEGMKDITAIL